MASPINTSQAGRITQTNLQTNTQSTPSNPALTAAPTLVSHTKREELKTAALTGDLVAVAELLNDFPNIDEVLDIKTGTTALSLAAENGQYDVVDVLLDAGAGKGRSGVKSLANSMLGAAKANEEGILELLASKRQDNLANAVPVLRLLARKAENQAVCNLLIAKYQGSGNAQPSTSSTSTTATAPTFIITTTTTTSTGLSTSTFTTTAAPTLTTGTTTTSATAPAPAAQAVGNFPHPTNCTKDEIQAMFNAAKAGDENRMKEFLARGMVAVKMPGNDQCALGEAARKNQLNIVKLILEHPTAGRISKEDKAAAITSSKFETNGHEIEKAIRDSETGAIRVNTVKACDISDAMDAENYYRQHPDYGNRNQAPAGGGNSSSSSAMMDTMTSGFELSHIPPAGVDSSSSSSSSAAQPVVVTEAMKSSMNDAARRGDLGKIKQLLAQGMPMGTVLSTVSGETVLSVAARKGHSAVVANLMQNGGKDLSRAIKERAILAAATASQGDVIRELLVGFSPDDQVLERVKAKAEKEFNDFASEFLASFRR